MWPVIYDPFTKLVRTLYEMIEIMKWDHVYGFNGMMFYFNGLVCDGRKDWWIFLKGFWRGASWALHWLGFGNPPPHALKMGWACFEERLLVACIRCVLARDIDMDVIAKMRILNHTLFELRWDMMWLIVIPEHWTCASHYVYGSTALPRQDWGPRSLVFILLNLKKFSTVATGEQDNNHYFWFVNESLCPSDWSF